MQNTHPAWPVKTTLRMTLDWSGMAKETAMMGGVEFLSRAGGRHSEKSSKKTGQLFLKTGRLQARITRITRTLKDRNKHSGLKCTNHK